MSKSFKYLTEVKFDAVDSYLTGKKSEHQIARELGIHLSTIEAWVSLYKSLGISGLMPASINTGYPEQVKRNAVTDYLSGDYSQTEICEAYGIRSRNSLRKWVLKYNGHEKVKSSKPKEESFMTNGYITTFEERIEIVKYCIEHNRNYSETAEKYQISYQQVRSWVVKYDKSGVNALTDRRGKRKPEDQLTELELLKAQNKLLEAKNKRLEMENDLLKKLEELERRGY
jgi:transposase-like protein